MLYQQLSKITTKEWSELSVEHPFYLFLSCILVIVNLGLEWKKWEIGVEYLGIQTNLSIRIKSFFAGIVTGLLTPNMIGNFIGRIYYFQRRHRIQLILQTLIANFTQFFASLFFGVLAILILNRLPFEGDAALTANGLLGLSIVLCVLFFSFEKLVFGFLKRIHWVERLNVFVRNYPAFRWKMIGLSLLRHFIFTLQFWLMLNAFTASLTMETFFWIWQVYLWTTLIPSLWFGKLLIRESVALLVLGILGLNRVDILFTSILVWIVNLGLPAIIGVIIIKKTK